MSPCQGLDTGSTPVTCSELRKQPYIGLFLYVKIRHMNTEKFCLIMKKLAKIDLSISNKRHKLFSLTRGVDGSIYVMFLMGIGHGKYNYSKFSYHPDGKSHIKVYSSGNITGIEMRFPQNIPLSEVKGIVNTNFTVSLKDLHNILFEGISLNNGEGKKDYSFYKEINSSEYNNITVRFFLLEKEYGYRLGSTRIYKQIFLINQEDIDILITLEDIWIESKETS